MSSSAPRPEQHPAQPDSTAGTAERGLLARAGLSWSLHGDGRSVSPGGVVPPQERLSWPRTIGIGVSLGEVVAAGPKGPRLTVGGVVPDVLGWDHFAG